MALHPADPWGIIGHEAILDLLPRLRASTLLFSGPEGVGRRRVARWYGVGLNPGLPPPFYRTTRTFWRLAPRRGA